MVASQKLSSSLARSDGLKSLVNRCLNTATCLHAGIAPSSPLARLPSYSLLLRTRVVLPKRVGWDWGWVRWWGRKVLVGDTH